MSERSSRAREMFEAHIARHHAHIARAMAIHERAVAAAERRVAYAMRAHLQAVDPIELIRAIKGRRKPPGGRPRRDLEGGDGVPAVPKPRPNPLAGAAAAPIE